MTTYYRTGKGAKRHASIHCANARRTVRTGDPIAIPARNVRDYAPCQFCCKNEQPAQTGAQALTEHLAGIVSRAVAPKPAPKPTAYYAIDCATGKRLFKIPAGSKVEAERKLRRSSSARPVLDRLSTDGKGWKLEPVR